MQTKLEVYFIKILQYRLGLTADCIGTIISSISAFVVGPIIAFIASWRLTLVSLAIAPLLILSAKY